MISCSSAPRYKSDKYRVKSKTQSVNTKKTSTPQLMKVTKVIIDTSRTEIIGISSYYGKDFHGKLTANGEIFDMYGVTAAHKTLPLNTVARVTNLDNGKSIILRVNDRGPYIVGRELDCSYGAAKKLGFLKQGMAEVKIKIIEFGDNKYMHHK
jgi:rare lipoprotein A